MGAPIKPTMPQLTIPLVGKSVGDPVPAAKGQPGSAAPPSISPTGLATRASKARPAPRGAKPGWAVGASLAATEIATHIRSRENVARLGPQPFGRGGSKKVDESEVDEWELDSPGASPASPGASPWSVQTAVGEAPGSPGSPGSALSGTTLPGGTTSSPTTAKAGGQSPAADDASPTVLNNLGSSKSSGSKSSGGGSKAAAAVGAAAAAGVAGVAGVAGKAVAAVADKVLPKGSGAQGVAQALNPLAQSPTVNAAGNLADVVTPDVGGAMQKLSTDAQANQMAAVGSDIGKWAKVQQQTLTHDNNEDALGAMKDSAGSTKTDIAMRNTATKLQNADSYAKMVASFVRKTGKTADEIAQGNN